MSEPTERSDERTRALLAPLADEAHRFAPDRCEAVWTQIAAERAAAARRGRALTLAAGAGVALAAAMLLWARAPAPESSPAPVPAAGIVASAPARSALAPGVRLSEATELPSGARATVEGEVLVERADARATRLRVSRGSVRSVVPKLKPGESYVVATALAEVVVRGTDFTVRDEDGATVVRVAEGVVEVVPADGRSAVRLLAGESHRLESLDEAGARSAGSHGDWKQAVEIWAALRDRTEGLARRNLVLRVGRLLERHAPTEALSWWRDAATRYPTGTHAEEYAFRLAESLHEAGRSDEARRAAADFERRFPASDRIPELRGW